MAGDEPPLPNAERHGQPLLVGPPTLAVSLLGRPTAPWHDGLLMDLLAEELT